jgi:hypothetical protein
MRNLPFMALALLNGTMIASAIGIFIAAEVRDRKETPAQVAECHGQQGTAKLDRWGFYRGCLVPPRVSR